MGSLLEDIWDTFSNGLGIYFKVVLGPSWELSALHAALHSVVQSVLQAADFRSSKCYAELPAIGML